ncbi:hypothetical protein [Poriferisphaera sp. WC338]|uniref:hypothetical protein n=1 Tax=Poriferisphaera sp. WC338 TaxID=3425129 RepID=UPI003D814A31
MKNFLSWTKTNPIAVLSICIVVVSFGVFYFFAVRGGAQVREEADKWNKHYKEVQGYMRASVDVPDHDQHNPPVTVSGITVNQKVIDDMKDIYEKLGGRYDALFSEVVAHNQAGHRVLIDGVFDENATFDAPYKFRDEYKNSFIRMLQPYDSIWGIPQINAGMPPTMEEIGVALAEAEDNYIESMRVTRGMNAQPTPEDEEKILQSKRERLLEIIQNQALNINVYADTEFTSQAFPFQVGKWSLESEKPELHDLFEGQVELWVQQDIVDAIARANKIVTEDDNGELIANDTSSVLTAPVKRLISISVVPGYVGIQTQGVVGSGSSSRTSSNSGGYSPPMEMMNKEAGNGPLGENFYCGPTGRKSNVIYDVRQAVLTAIVDYERLPELFEAINEVNFMTVVDCKVEQVDEYEALAEGYMYGSNDCVQVEMVIESLWMRQWTEPLMPDKTLEYVGLKEPSEPVNGGGMYGGDMFMEDFGDF